MLRRKYSHDNKAYLYYMDTDSFIVNIKAEDVCKGTAKDVENKFGTSNNEIERPLQITKNKNVIWLINNDLDENIMTEFVWLRSKT